MNTIVFDIETKGITANDEITVIGLEHSPDPSIHNLYVFYQEPPVAESEKQTPTHIEEYVREEINDITINGFPSLSEYSIKVNSVEAESDLIQEAQKQICELAAEGVGNNATIVGFNSANFDFQMLRTRSLKNSVEWLISGYDSLDIMKSYQYNFRTNDYDVDGLNKPPKKKFAQQLGIEGISSQTADQLTQTIKNHGYSDEELAEFISEEGLETPTVNKGNLDEIFELLTDTTVEEEFESGKMQSTLSRKEISLISSYTTSMISGKPQSSTRSP